MKLKFRIALLFSLFVFIILMISAVSIYIWNEEFRKEEFYKRLRIEAETAAKLFSATDTITSGLLQHLVEEKNGLQLNEQQMAIYHQSGVLIDAYPSNYNPNISQEILNASIENTAEFFTLKKREHVVLYVSNSPQPFYVVVSAFDLYGRNKINKLWYILIVTVLFSLVLSAIFSYIYVRQVVKPLEKMSRQIRRISEENLKERVNAGKASDELSQIATNFNEMLDRLEHGFEMRKSFVQHASHELRTPLAKMLAQTEAALVKPLDEKQSKEILASLKEEQQEMINLTNSLLLLSQYQKLSSLPETSLIRIDELLHEAIELTAHLFPTTNIIVHYLSVPEDESLLTLKGNETLIKSALQNLIRNACHYSSNNEVNITIDANKSKISLYFDNKGTPLTKEEQERIFIPFFRAQNSMNKRGFGLGLTIVQQILNLHKATIQYAWIEDSTHRFIVNFPVSR